MVVRVEIFLKKKNLNEPGKKNSEIPKKKHSLRENKKRRRKRKTTHQMN